MIVISYSCIRYDVYNGDKIKFCTKIIFLECLLYIRFPTIHIFYYIRVQSKNQLICCKPSLCAAVVSFIIQLLGAVGTSEAKYKKNQRVF